MFPNLAVGVVPGGRDELWVADITYIAVAAGFVYVALVVDAWSRRVVGYAIGRSIDTRLTVAALDAAVRSRCPSIGCIHHSDSEYVRAVARGVLTHTLIDAGTLVGPVALAWGARRPLYKRAGDAPRLDPHCDDPDVLPRTCRPPLGTG